MLDLEGFNYYCSYDKIPFFRNPVAGSFVSRRAGCESFRR